MRVASPLKNTSVSNRFAENAWTIAGMAASG
jgi:hypothetical protein